MTPTMVSQGLGFCCVLIPHRSRFPTASCPGQKVRASRSLTMTTPLGSMVSIFENTPPLFHPTPERLKRGAVAPRKVLTAPRHVGPFGRKHAVLVTLERQIRHQRRRAYAWQGGCAGEERVVKIADAGRRPVAGSRKRKRSCQHTIGIEPWVGLHESGEAPDEQPCT